MLGNSFIKEEYFKDINFEDTFFDSLKNDYVGFSKWFNKKSTNNEKVFASKGDEGLLNGFLYLKDENEEDSSIEPNFEKKERLKVGTFKIDAHGTTLGEHFIKLIIVKLYKGMYEEAYVTIFPKHKQLINLLKKYGFVFHGIKTSEVGKEDVYVKDKSFKDQGDMYLNYPIINLKDNKFFLLSIYPKFHSRMFPYSKLNTEKAHIVEDLSYTNSIEKIYIAGMQDIKKIKKNDLLIIYRTAEIGKSARYSSVATSVCTVIEVKHMDNFKDIDEYLKYCTKFSIFSESELKSFWESKRYPYLIKMLYNIALSKRIVRHKLIEDIGLNESEYWGVLELSNSQIIKILELGEVNESFVVN